jgi:hypothetical protein
MLRSMIFFESLYNKNMKSIIRGFHEPMIQFFLISMIFTKILLLLYNIV